MNYNNIFFDYILKCNNNINYYLYIILLINFLCFLLNIVIIITSPKDIIPYDFIKKKNKILGFNDFNNFLESVIWILSFLIFVVILLSNFLIRI